MSDNPQYVFMVGNPGVGKSTLLSSLCGEAAFKSGLSVGKGLTAKMQMRKVGDITYIDTPGLDDAKMREQAALEIKEALKQNGEYRLFFVATLEAGRVRPSDIATIKLVLDALPNELEHCVVFNKVTKRLMETLKGAPDAGKAPDVEAIKDIVACLFTAGRETQVQNVFLMPKDADAEDEDGYVMTLPEDHPFRVFVNRAPKYFIRPEQVKDIEHDKFEAMSEKFESVIKELREDSAKKDKMIQDLLRENSANKDKMIQDFQDILKQMQNQKPQVHVVEPKVHVIEKIVEKQVPSGGACSVM